jgi:hypothetical protein
MKGKCLLNKGYNVLYKKLQPVARNATTGVKNAPVEQTVCRKHTDFDFRSTWIDNEIGEMEDE